MEMARELQEECLMDDGKKGLIEEYLSDKSRTCVIEVWEKALHENGRLAKWQSSEIANIILSIDGWKKMSYPEKFNNYGSQRGFRKCSSSSKTINNDFITVSDSELNKLPFN